MEPGTIILIILGTPVALVAIYKLIKLGKRWLKRGSSITIYQDGPRTIYDAHIEKYSSSGFNIPNVLDTITRLNSNGRIINDTLDSFFGIDKSKMNVKLRKKYLEASEKMCKIVFDIDPENVKAKSNLNILVFELGKKNVNINRKGGIR